MSILNTKSNLNFSLLTSREIRELTKERTNGWGLAIINLILWCGCVKYYEMFLNNFLLSFANMFTHTLCFEMCKHFYELIADTLRIGNSLRSTFPMISFKRSMPCIDVFAKTTEKKEMEKIVYKKFITFVTHVFPQWRCHKISS